jgi:hypothetical protein
LKEIVKGYNSKFEDENKIRFLFSSPFGEAGEESLSYFAQGAVRGKTD